MEEKVINILSKYGAKNGKKFVLAVSGGVDSRALFEIVKKNLSKDSFVVAHINHGLRAEATTDAEFVRNMVEKEGIEYFETTLNLKKGTEEEARKERYDYLEKIRLKSESDFIVTAHHLNDQAETVIFNLIRGVGPLDFWGMEELSGRILRPMLNISKQEIVEYAKELKLKWVEDKSNEELAFSRNRIRRNIIPEFEKINPSFLGTFKNETVLGKESTKELEELVEKAEFGARKDDALILSNFKGLNSFLKRALVFKMAKELTGAEISFKNVESILSLIDKKGNKKTVIGGFTIAKEYDKISFDAKENSKQGSEKISFPDQLEFNEFKFVFRIGKAEAKKNNIILPLRFSEKLIVRTWIMGDRIKTTSGSKKIQDLFTDNKINASKRKTWPIVTTEEEILWVPLLAASDKAKNKSNNDLIIEVN